MKSANRKVGEPAAGPVTGGPPHEDEMDQHNVAGVEDLAIGKKVRQLRSRRKLTLQQLSEKTGLSKPLLSQVENGHVVPPVATLLKIAAAVGVNISHFFQVEEREVRVSLTRAAERSSVGPRPHQTGEEGGYAYESLEIHKARKSMQPLWVHFAPMATDKMVFYSHEGEECVYLMAGRAEFRTPEGSWTMEEGDCLYFDSDVPHAFRSLGKAPAEAFVIVYAGGRE